MRAHPCQKWASLMALVLASVSVPSVAAVSAEGSQIENTVSATTISTCNPLSATSCSPNSALATSISDDFKAASGNYIPYRTPSQIFYGDDGLTLTLAKRYDNPSLVSDFYIMFGKIQVSLKSAPGTGVISSFYLQSDDLDEIDLEWFGGDVSQMQSNYFSKGNTTTHDRGEYHDMADPRAEFHNYTIDWDESALSWYIDGNLVRTLANTSSEGYPQSPMRLFFGIWAGGDPSNNEGTIEWAGGETDYSDVPFSMAIAKLVVSDYSTGKEYEYSDTSGEWTSIKAVDGEVNGRKVIAMAEFASLASGNEYTSNSTDSVSKSSAVSASPSPSSISESETESDSSFDEATPTSKSEKQKSLDSGSSITTHTKEKTTATEDAFDAESTGTEKTVNLKSKYLSSSTATLHTATTSKSKKSDGSSSSSKEEKSASSSVSAHSNAANNRMYAGPSFAAALILMLSIL